MPFSEFACRSGGSNLNAGTRTGNATEPGTAADITYASGTWVAATRTFTPAGGANPTTDGVAVGDFVSIYPDAATVSPYIARITVVGSTTFETSATAKSGTAPVDGPLVTTAKIGGAWLGPNAASGFPLNFVTNTLTNVAADLPRINYKNDATYSITANITGVGADTTHQGYTSAYGDLGRATLDGGTSGASYNLIGTTVGGNASLVDFICKNNGATGSASGVFWNNAGRCVRCVFTAFRGHGFQSNASTAVIECEAYACNQSNAGSLFGFSHAGNGGLFLRCVSHDNTGSNAGGFNLGGNFVIANNCIADTNGGIGFTVPVAGCRILNCDSYNNTGDGIQIVVGGNGNIAIENCNLIKNGGWGINFSGAGAYTGQITNCGFGAGTQANTSGTTTGSDSVEIAGSVTYAANVTPWLDPANGDFRVSLATAKGVGRGTFTQTAPSYAGTVGFPDIGAAQSQAASAGMFPSLMFKPQQQSIMSM